MIAVARARDEGSPPESGEEILAAAEREVARMAAKIRSAALERAFAVEAAKMVDAETRPWGAPAKKLLYMGQELLVKVARVKARDAIKTPALYTRLKEDPHGIKDLLAAGLGVRAAERVLRANPSTGSARGTSRTTVGRTNVEVGEEHLHTLMSRRFEDEAVVAVMVDGTAVAGPMVVVAIGITADGRKLTLGAVVGPSESKALVRRLVDGLLARGLDNRVLWISDDSDNIRSAIREIAPPEGAHLQNCTVHKARRVIEHHLKGEPKEFQEAVRERMKKAWAEPNADVALVQLEALAVDLAGEGHGNAADSLRRNIGDTVTVTRLGLAGTVRQQLQSTNLLESINDAIKEHNRDVSEMTGDEMRLRRVAQALLEREAHKWVRLADAEALIAMNQRLAPGLNDPAVLLARVPPKLEVRKVLGDVAEEAGARQAAARWLAGPGRAQWVGSEAALAKLRLRPGQEVRVDHLALAVRGQDTGNHQVRQPGNVTSKVTDDHGLVHEQKVRRVTSVGWTLDASTALSKRYFAAGQAEREAIERGMMRAAQAAIGSLTRTTEEGHGFATTIRLSVDDREGASVPRLRVDGIVVGVTRGGKALRSPAERAFEARRAREAEDAGKAVLDDALGVAPVPARRAIEQAGAARPASRPFVGLDREPARPAFPDSFADHRELLGRRARLLDERATELAAGLVGQSDEFLVGMRDMLGEPFEPLTRLPRSAVRATETLERDKRIALDELERALEMPGQDGATRERQAREKLESLETRKAELVERDRHIGAWVSKYGKQAAQVVALEREAERRGLDSEPAQREAIAAEAELSAQTPAVEPPGAEHAAIEAADAGFGL